MEPSILKRVPQVQYVNTQNKVFIDNYSNRKVININHPQIPNNAFKLNKLPHFVDNVSDPWKN